MSKKYYYVSFEASEPWNEWEEAYLYMTKEDYKELEAYLDDEESNFDMDAVCADIAWKIGIKLYPEHLDLLSYEEFASGEKKTPLLLALEDARDCGYDEEVDVLMDALNNKTWSEDHSTMLAEIAMDIVEISCLSPGYEDEEGEDEAENDFIIEVF